MKYNIKIGDKTYNVELEDIYARPILARVDGERVEVMPENAPQAEARAAKPQCSSGEPSRSAQKQASAKSPIAESKASDRYPASAASPAPHPALSGNIIAAPLPGTVVEVFVKPGDKVETGQVVLVIEAMKMKNSIRSTWSGQIGEVLVSLGQTVAHKQALVKFADLGEAAWM